MQQKFPVDWRDKVDQMTFLTARVKMEFRDLLTPCEALQFLSDAHLLGASLVAQWLRNLLPVQGTQVQTLVWEDPTCHGATKPMCHNYWACVSQLLKPAHLEPVLRNKRSHRNAKPTHHNEE